MAFQQIQSLNMIFEVPRIYIIRRTRFDQLRAIAGADMIKYMAMDQMAPKRVLSSENIYELIVMRLRRFWSVSLEIVAQPT